MKIVLILILTLTLANGFPDKFSKSEISTNPPKNATISKKELQEKIEEELNEEFSDPKAENLATQETGEPDLKREKLKPPKTNVDKKFDPTFQFQGRLPYPQDNGFEYLENFGKMNTQKNRLPLKDVHIPSKGQKFAVNMFNNQNPYPTDFDFDFNRDYARQTFPFQANQKGHKFYQIIQSAPFVRGGQNYFPNSGINQGGPGSNEWGFRPYFNTKDEVPADVVDDVVGDDIDDVVGDVMQKHEDDMMDEEALKKVKEMERFSYLNNNNNPEQSHDQDDVSDESNGRFVFHPYYGFVPIESVIGRDEAMAPNDSRDEPSVEDEDEYRRPAPYEMPPAFMNNYSPYTNPRNWNEYNYNPMSNNRNSGWYMPPYGNMDYNREMENDYPAAWNGGPPPSYNYPQANNLNIPRYNPLNFNRPDSQTPEIKVIIIRKSNETDVPIISPDETELILSNIEDANNTIEDSYNDENVVKKIEIVPGLDRRRRSPQTPIHFNSPVLYPVQVFPSNGLRQQQLVYQPSNFYNPVSNFLPKFTRPVEDKKALLRDSNPEPYNFPQVSLGAHVIQTPLPEKDYPIFPYDKDQDEPAAIIF